MYRTKTYNYLYRAIRIVQIGLAICLFNNGGYGQSNRFPSPDATTVNKFSLNNIIDYGHVNLSYEYGLLPFLNDLNPPQGNFITEGSIGFSIKDIPINGSFYHATQKSISGLSNFFSIQFDAQRYRQQIRSKLSEEKLNKEVLIGQLQSQKQALLKKIAYVELIQSGEIPFPEKGIEYDIYSNIVPLLKQVENFQPDVFQNDYRTIVTEKIIQIEDSLNTIADEKIIQIEDSLNTIADEKIIQIEDSLNTYETAIIEKQKNLQNKYTDKINANNLESEVRHSITSRKEVATLKNKLETQLGIVNDAIDDLNRYKALNIDSLYQEGILPKGYMPNRIANILSYLRKFEIGMCYPNHSEFLVARIPVRGFNMEYQKRNIYFAFTYGKAIKPLPFSTNRLYNNITNFHKIFDFGNVNAGRNITAVKIGYGAKEANHLHIGFLYGLGKTSYSDSIAVSDKEKNYVFEIDSRIKIAQNHILDIKYGRSYIQVHNITYDDEQEGIRKLFDFGERTNAFLAQYQMQLPKIGTEAKISFRWIDPFFRSFGLGFIRSDNLRYELRIKQKINKRLKLSGFIRNEEDNLLKIYDFENRLFSYGIAADYRPVNKLLLKAEFRPIEHRFDSSADSLQFGNNNWFLNVVGSYHNRFKKTEINITGVYSLYRLQNEGSINNYQNINITSNIIINNKWQGNLLFNRFQTTDSLQTSEVNVLQQDISLQLKKVSLTGMFKLAFSKEITPQIGYGFKTSITVGKHISVELSGEKLVLGDFYNNLNINSLNTFTAYYKAGIRFFM